MTNSAARADGEVFLTRTELENYDNYKPRPQIVIEARRVVTALLDALRPLTELARLAEGDTRPKVTTELTANAEARPALTELRRLAEGDIRPQVTTYMTADPVAASSLIVEQLAALLREWDGYDSTERGLEPYMRQAAWMLPRLAGRRP